MQSTKPILIAVSAGELIDKITILEIKAERFTDPVQLGHVREELALLAAARQQALPELQELVELSGQLKSVNEELWQIEDAIRQCEQAKDFGPRFVELARSVYRTNDRRWSLKRQINTLVRSSLVEEKGYTAYEGGGPTVQ